jgi:nucleoside-diphosphate-sugar epimerase
MHILMTGHLGYIGPVMIRLFKQQGLTVTGLDVGYFRDCIPGGDDIVAPDREIVRDIRSVRPEDLEGVDAVVHLAALSNDPMGEFDPTITHAINLEASLRVARLAKAAGAERFVFASSCSIYGAAGGSERPLDETAPFNPVSAYAVSKVKMEEGLHELADDRFSPVYLRNGTAYGVSPRLRLDLVLNNLMAWAHAIGRIRVMSDGTPWRPIVHIEDISRAALAAVTAPREAIHDQPFNVGRPDCNYQVSQIAEAVAATVPGAELEITGETGGDPRSYRVDFTKAATRLPGFDPQWTLEKGCQELDAWMKAHPLEEASMGSRTFIRLKQLRHLVDTGQVDQRLFPTGASPSSARAQASTPA